LEKVKKYILKKSSIFMTMGSPLANNVILDKVRLSRVSFVAAAF
jgi:hypothetical protein